MATIRGLALLSKKELLSLTSSGHFNVDALTREVDGKEHTAWRTVGESALIPRYVLDWSSLPDNIKVRQATPQAVPPMYTFQGEMREHQKPIIDPAVKGIQAYGGITLLADCGTGKTVMGLKIASLVADDVVILVDQIDIAEQWRDQINNFLPDASVVILGGGNALTQTVSANFRIVVAQSLYRKDWLETPLETALLIVDEAHVFAAPRFLDSVANISFRHSLALTATPDRKDGLEDFFLMCLGIHQLKVKGKAMTSRVIQVASPKFSPDVLQKDYEMAWCQTIGGMTYKAKCENCNNFGAFPVCGPLKKNSLGKVAWNSKKLNITGLTMAACSSPTYLEWLHRQIDILYRKGRNIIVLSAYTSILEALYDAGVSSFGQANAGWFVGKKGKKATADRSNELLKPVTYATYGVAAKALDVPLKDCAVFATPRSDIRQPKGRIERAVKGKPQPLILDPIHSHLPLFRGMGLKRKKTYLEYGCNITYKTL